MKAYYLELPEVVAQSKFENQFENRNNLVPRVLVTLIQRQEREPGIKLLGYIALYQSSLLSPLDKSNEDSGNEITTETHLDFVHTRNF